MSVVAVKIYKDKIEMAADSIIVHGEADKTPIGKGKIFEINDVIVGTSGYASEGVMLSLFLENHKPLAATERDIMAFMLEFQEWKNKNGNDFRLQNSYLIAYKGKAFYVNDNYIAEVDNYFAIGYGHQYAEAALYLGHNAKIAIEAACALCCYVSDPIVVKYMDK